LTAARVVFLRFAARLNVAWSYCPMLLRLFTRLSWDGGQILSYLKSLRWLKLKARILTARLPLMNMFFAA
jgi:hypothetical protein